MNINDFAIQLASHRTSEGHAFECEAIPGEVDVLHIELNDEEAFPVFMTQTRQQILCIVYLWTEAEVKPESRLELLESMLDASIAMPLSSFARVGDRFVLFGALSVHSDLATVVEEIITLNENATEVLGAMAEHLI